MMNRISFFTGLILIVVMFSCSGPKIATTVVSNKDVAEKAMSEGNFAEATNAWKSFFEQTPIEQVSGNVFAEAAQSAYKSNDISQAVSWFDQARYKNFSSAEMYSTLANIYHSQKNISKELSALEFYAENFSENMNEVNISLFEIYFEINEYDKALEIWEKLNEDSKSNISNLKSYFTINKKLGNSTVCDSVSLVILKTEPENIDALEWNADKYYWLGQNRYEREMKKYEQNKTNKQYKILLSELELVTADFKKALPYLDKLWKLKPGEKYASYYANIYARFGDEAKVNYYKKYLK